MILTRAKNLGQLASIATALAVAAVGYAIQESGGTFSIAAIAGVALAWGLAMSAVANGLPASRLSALKLNWRVVAIAAAFCCTWVWLLDEPLVSELRGHSMAQPLLVAGVLAAVIFTADERWSRIAFVLLLLWYVALGLWVLLITRFPGIDVLMFQFFAVDELLAGRNPYAMTFPNIYSHTLFYGEGLVVNGRLQFGFPYPPLSLIAVLPAKLLGDARYAHLLACAGAAALMAAMQNNRESRAAAALFLCTSRGFYVLKEGWTEPLVIFFLALSVWTALHAPRWSGWCLGLFFAVKQYVAVVALVLPLLAERSLRKTLHLAIRIGVVVALITLPFALADPRAFFHSVVELQSLQPFRPDALSFLNLFTDLRTPLIAFVLLIPGAALAWWRAPASPAGFAAATALLLLTFFAWNKQAFCNYYFCVIGALCITLAAAPLTEAYPG